MKLKSFNLILLLVCFSLTLHAQEWKMPPATVEVANVEKSDLAASISIPANIISQSYGWVSAETTGRVRSMLAIGTQVKKGDVIAVINTATLSAQRKEQETSAKSAEAQIKYLRNQVARLNELRSQNIAAISQLEETQSQLDVAISSKAAANSRIAQVDIGLAASKLRAQFDGMVTEHGIKTGEWAGPGREVIRIVNLKDKEIVARTTIANIRFSKVDDTLTIKQGTLTGLAKIIAMVPFGEITDGIYEIRMSLEKGDWKVGESILVVLLQANSESVITVPRDAILLRSGGSSVIKVNKDNSFNRIQVSTGLGNLGRISVTAKDGKLNVGDRVIIRGGERLQDGQEISIKE